MAKLILTHDVPNLGAAGEIVTVKDGYARNYLVPRRLAEKWTPGAERALERLARARRRKEIATIDDARAVRDTLEAAKFFEVAKRTSATEALYGAVSSADIAAAVKEQVNVTLDRRTIVIDQAIKRVGDFRVRVNLHPEVAATITVRVVAA